MRKPIGELFLRGKLISKNQLETALEEQKKSGGRLNEHLLRLGYVNEDKLVEFLGRHYNVPTINLEKEKIDPEIIKLVPADICRKHMLIPVNRTGNVLAIAVSDPGNLFAQEDVKFLTGMSVSLITASEQGIKAAIEKYYGRQNVQKTPATTELHIDTVDDVMDLLEVIESPAGSEAKKEELTASDAPIIKLVNLFLVDAVSKNASDIHIEPYEKFMRVRYRIDGILYEMMQPPLALKQSVASRIKLMAGMNISEKRIPQDGGIRLKIGDSSEPIDFRVSTVPSIFGERLVLRILKKENLKGNLTSLGLEERQLENFKWAIAQPYGMILITGPTGSGKTTTLYSTLTELNKPNVNISTVEDPIEYNIPSLNQVHVRPDIGLTFASALRSFLRQDPDIIMVGEIRDLETAEIAIKSSLTGHLVLSTLHTNDAPSTVTRLLNMGVEPFLVASAVLLIVAQRLVRKICPSCKEEVETDVEALIKLGVPEKKAASFKIYKGAGCKQCGKIGYKGRIGIYEVMKFGREIREAILRGDSTSEIRRLAIESGVSTMRQSALNKLESGITTIEEVVRTTALVR